MKKVIVGVLLGLGAVYLFMLRHPESKTVEALDEQRTPASISTPVIDEPGAREAELRPFDYHFKNKQIYNLSFTENSLGANNRGTFADSQMSGNAELNVIKRVGDHYFAIVRFDLTRSHFSASSDSDQNASAPVPLRFDEAGDPRFRNALMVQFEISGKIREVRALPESPSDEAAATLAGLLVSVTHVLPTPDQSNPRNPIVQTEKDHKGQSFQMSFSFSEPIGDLISVGGSLVPIDLTMTKNARVPAGFSMNMDQAATLSIRWSKNLGLPVSISQNSHFRIGTEKELIAKVSSDSSVTWSVGGATLYSDQDLLLFTRLIDVEAMKARAKEAKNRNALAKDKERAEQLFKSVVGDAKPSDKEASKAYRNIADLLKKNPALVQDYLSAAKSYPPGSRQVSMMIGAFGSLGSPEAQGALLAISQRTGATDMEKGKVIQQFTLMTEAVVPAAKNYLLGLYNGGSDTGSLAKMAGYALGSSLTRETDPQLIGLIQAQFNAANTDEQKVYALKIIGNAPPTYFLPQITAAEASSSVSVQVAAAQALRGANDEASKAALVSLLNSTTNPSVRQAVYSDFAAQPYDSQTQSVLQNCVQNETLSSLTTPCYGAMITHAQDPATKAFLQTIASKNPQSPMADRIQRAIASQ